MIAKQFFGTLEDGQQVYAYTMRNAAGMTVRICEFGGAIMEIRVPDRLGRFSDVLLSFDSLRDYVLGNGYQGALIGRVGNRIAGAKFTLDGKEYQLCENKKGYSIHGGKVGFSHRVWSSLAQDGEEPKLILTLHSPDGEEGYPGNLDVTVTYTLTASNGLSIHYQAVTDRKTILNMTNHAYFNLGGYASGSILQHVLQIDADRYLTTDESQIPTGEMRAVEGTPFDFREPKPIGRDIDMENEDLRIGCGYDHCFCFTGGESREPVLRAEAYDPDSGRLMQVYTNQPAVQLYTANHVNKAEFPFKGGYPQTPRTAFCLETQKMPDAIHHPHFDSVVLEPGETYDYTTVYRFSVR